MKMIHAKKLARKFTSRRMLSDVEALGVLYEIKEKKASLELNEAIKTLENKVLGGNNGKDVVVFIEDCDGEAVECYKIKPEDSYREPFRSIIDEWGSATLQEYVVDIIDNPDMNWKAEISMISEKSAS